MKKKNQFEYTRVLKLPPAIGDWTTIQYQDPSEDVNISPVVNINFDSFPKDDLRKAHLLHYMFADRLTHKLSKDMNLKVELHTVSASQMSYGDFLNSQEDKVVQADFVIKNLGRVNMIMEWDLADMVVDRLTGGKGEGTQPSAFSEIELHVLHDHVQDIVPHFAFAWGQLFRHEDVAMEFVTGRYKRDRKITLREAYIIFTSYIHFGRGTVKKVICAYPNIVLRRLLNLHARKDVLMKPNIALKANTMRGMQLDVTAKLGQATLTMSELKQLDVGDVIPLDTTLDSPIELRVGEEATLYAQPGVVDNHLSAQVIFWDGVSEPGGLVHSDEAALGSPLAQAPLIEEIEPNFENNEPSYPLVEDTLTEEDTLLPPPPPPPPPPPAPVAQEPEYEALDLGAQPQEHVTELASMESNEVDNYGEDEIELTESFSEGNDVSAEAMGQDFDEDDGLFDEEVGELQPEGELPPPPAPAPVGQDDFGDDDDDDYSWDDLEDDF